MATIIPCPGLLIWDLGDPKRFHHMLRVWKPSTPMNLGSWAITLFGAHAAFDAVRQYINIRGEPLSAGQRGQLRKLMNSGTLMMVHDAAGVPLALMVASYTGVLLSCTSNPLWCKNPWLAPLFAASSLSTGTEAVSLAMDWRRLGLRGTGRPAAHGHACATSPSWSPCAASCSTPAKKPTRSAGGRTKRYHHFATGAVVAAEVLKYVPLPRRLEKPRRILSMALGMAGGFALRWAMVSGGHEAAADPHLSRTVSRQRNNNDKPSHPQLKPPRRAH